jgi:hypothetical protein
MSDLNDKNLKGAFFDSLNRNNRKIKRDRAVAITEDAQLLYKREIEDMEMQLKRLNRERDGMLDLSPTTADSLVLASDFDGKAFVGKDLDIGLKVATWKLSWKSERNAMRCSLKQKLILLPQPQAMRLQPNNYGRCINIYRAS